MRKFQLVLIALGLLIITLWTDLDRPLLYAEEVSCDTLKNNFQQAIDRCFEINGNYVCYGGPVAQVEPPPFRFNNLKDRRPLPDLKEINPDKNGVVILDLHIPGQQPIVRAVLFGALNLETIDPRKHIFTIRKADSGEFVCTATPPGMVVRTEPGVAGQVTINGVTIRLKSSVFITMESSDRMVITNLQGQVELDNGIESLELQQGFQIGVGLNGQLEFLRPSTPSSYYDSGILQWLITNESGMKRIQNTNENSVSADACAQRIEFGEPIIEQNINPGHECLFTFCAEKGERVTVKMDALDAELNPWVDLRGPDDKIVSFNNDIGQADQNSLLCNVGLPVNGCYTIVARSHSNDSSGQFRLTLERQSACMPPPSPCTGLHPNNPDCQQLPKRHCTKTIVISPLPPPFSPLPEPYTEVIDVPCEDAG